MPHKPKLLLRWTFNLLYASDQFLNAVFCGDPDETISSRIGRCKKHHHGEIPWHHPVIGTLDTILEKIDPHHTIDAIEPGQHPRELWHWK